MIDDTTAELLKLDQAGFVPAPGMDHAGFIAQTEKILTQYRSFDEKLTETGKAEIFGMLEVSADARILPELIEETSLQTEKLYKFSVRHVPGFYLTKAVGLLWGGCMINDPEEHFSVMLLRNIFRKRRRFLNYNRDELLAHELCHSVRQSLAEPTLEEYFAYRTSPSRLRRYLGNCFISERDAVLFVLPMLLLPIAEILRAFFIPQLPSYPFWIAAVAYPVFLLIRNALSRKIVNQARKALKSCQVKEIEAVLFRATLQELKTFPDFAGQPENFRRYAKEKAQTELRWQVIVHRFIDNDELIDILNQEKGSCDHENS